MTLGSLVQILFYIMVAGNIYCLWRTREVWKALFEIAAHSWRNS